MAERRRPDILLINLKESNFIIVHTEDIFLNLINRSMYICNYTQRFVFSICLAYLLHFQRRNITDHDLTLP